MNMSRAYDAKNAALKAYPNSREKAVSLFIDFLGMDTVDFEYEFNMTEEEYIFGKTEKDETPTTD